MLRPISWRDEEGRGLTKTSRNALKVKVLAVPLGNARLSPAFSAEMPISASYRYLTSRQEVSITSRSQNEINFVIFYKRFLYQTVSLTESRAQGVSAADRGQALGGYPDDEVGEWRDLRLMSVQSQLVARQAKNDSPSLWQVMSRPSGRSRAMRINRSDSNDDHAVVHQNFACQPVRLAGKRERKGLM